MSICGLVRAHQRLELGDRRALRVGLLLRAGIGLRQLLVAREVELGIGERRLVLRLLRQRLIELGVIDRRIDLGEHVAALDVLAFLEQDGDQLALDLRAHRHGVQRADGADAFEIDRNVLGLRRRRQHRHRQIARIGTWRRPVEGHPDDVAEPAENESTSVVETMRARQRRPAPFGAASCLFGSLVRVRLK